MRELKQNFLVLPNQLFQALKELKIKNIILYEAEEYFCKYKFNKKKLLLHRASMQNFAEELKDESKFAKIKYFGYQADLNEVLKDIKKLSLFDPPDKEIKKRIKQTAEQKGIELEFLESPNFLNSRSENRAYFADNDFFQHKYYIRQRKKLNILLDEDNKPVGGKWSFDAKNRKKFPQEITIPDPPEFANPFLAEAKKYVENHFPDNPGKLDNFIYPLNRTEAEKLLQDFIENKLEHFGDYQDAFEKEIVFAFHSLLSSSLNIGLLNPDEVVEAVLSYYEKKELPLASVEGFIRQIIGWREYVKALYDLESENMEQSDFFKHQRDFPQQFYQANSGIKALDDSIEKALEHAYCHHIERLMVLGNFFLLSEIAKDQVFQWFMEMFIDAYDWVMYANIYGMSQYSYSKMMTKPYISSSNYIHKMSHYSKGEWSAVWDGLYWRFINKNKDKFSDNPRMSLMLSILDRMDEDKLAEHLKKAEEFLAEL